MAIEFNLAYSAVSAVLNCSRPHPAMAGKHVSSSSWQIATFLSGTGQRQLQEQQQRLVAMMSPAAIAPPSRPGLTATGSLVPSAPTRPQ